MASVVHCCPICHTGGQFAAFRGRPAALCPRCGALERQRLLALYLNRYPLTADLRILHFSPASCWGSRFAQLPHYLSVDLDGGRAATRVDITAIQFGDAQFDLVLCSHVLEHVPDDARAMCEMWRVLRATGKLLLQVPLSDAMTDEDLTIDDPQERTRRYGQADHVRNYGWDIIDRLNACGWQVALFRAAAWLPQDIDLYRIDGEILVCTKGLSDAS